MRKIKHFISMISWCVITKVSRKLILQQQQQRKIPLKSKRKTRKIFRNSIATWWQSSLFILLRLMYCIQCFFICLMWYLISSSTLVVFRMKFRDLWSSCFDERCTTSFTIFYWSYSLDYLVEQEYIVFSCFHQIYEAETVLINQ